MKSLLAELSSIPVELVLSHWKKLISIALQVGTRNPQRNMEIEDSVLLETCHVHNFSIRMT